MKLSVSLPAEDVEFLDAYAASQSISSRSGALHKAVRLLRASALGPDYEAAWSDWSGSEDEDLWAATVNDGLG